MTIPLGEIADLPAPALWTVPLTVRLAACGRHTHRDRELRRPVRVFYDPDDYGNDRATRPDVYIVVRRS